MYICCIWVPRTSHKPTIGLKSNILCIKCYLTKVNIFELSQELRDSNQTFFLHDSSHETTWIESYTIVFPKFWIRKTWLESRIFVIRVMYVFLQINFNSGNVTRANDFFNRVITQKFIFLSWLNSIHYMWLTRIMRLFYTNFVSFLKHV